MKKLFIIICSSLIWQICFAWTSTFRYGCGFANPDGIGFPFIAIPNNDADFGKFPWTAALMENKMENNETIERYVCSAALIAPNAVLTAAHCLLKHHDYFVRAGEWDLSNEFEQLAHQDRRIKKVFGHYVTALRFESDIVVVVLESPFELDDHIQPICLPDIGTNFQYSNCFKSGWGVSGPPLVLTDIMKEVHFNVISQNECEIANASSHFELKLSNANICARNRNDDICAGSSGAPLACPIPFTQNRYYLAGIVAGGVGCGLNDSINIFTNVLHYRAWIDSSLATFDIKPMTYDSGFASPRY